jgi:hypothetical protein
MAARMIAPSPVAEASNALPRWQRRTILAAATCLLVSGLAWICLHQAWGRNWWMVAGPEGSDGLPHPAEAWLMRWHGLSAVAGFFAAGLVASGHVARGWRLAWRRPTGLSLCIVGTLVALSGYALWYAPDSWHAAGGWAHAAAGAVAFTLGALHVRDRAPPPAR